MLTEASVEITIGQQRRPAAECTEFTCQPAAAAGQSSRDVTDDGEAGDDADRDHGPESRAPSGGLPECRPKGNAEHVGERQPGEQQRDRLRALLTRDEITGDHRTDAERRLHVRTRSR